MRISDWSSDVCSSDLAKVLTYTADSLTYTPDPPNYYGMIEFDGGGRMMIEFTDADPASIYVGAPVRMMFRIKAHDERSGFVKYFWKAVPRLEERRVGNGCVRTCRSRWSRYN